MRKEKKEFGQLGFTLTELIIVLGIVFVLTMVVLVGISPARQFETARDNQRKAHISMVYGAFMEYAARNNGDFPDCGMGGVSSSPIDIYDCQELVLEEYLESFPIDPDLGCVEDFYGVEFDSQTGYRVKKNNAGRIGIKAICAEREDNITAGDWVE